MKGGGKMKVAFCSSEVFPFSKTGGLADVCGALPLSLENQGVEVKIFTPLYKDIQPANMFDEWGVSKIGKNIEVVFIRNDNFFNRSGLYGTPEGDYPDNLERFSFFCFKILEVLKKINFKPDVIHCHDWQTGLVPVFLKYKFSQDLFYKDIKTVFTIHNLAYQGLFAQEEFSKLNLPPELFSIDGLEFYGKINILKGALLFSDILTTVSPTYAKEIQTEEFGCGLEGVLKKRAESLYGVLNGLDYSVWDPAKDGLIYKKYSPKNILVKLENKLKLQKDNKLKPQKEKFLLGFVGRLAEQKGIDLLAEVIPEVIENLNTQLIILGTGDIKYHQVLDKFYRKYSKGKFRGNFSLHIKFDEKLAHRIYAGVDCFLMPSRFEPCGLGQMISFKYGTIPIVHATGGLADTVVDYTANPQNGNGFVFRDMSKEAFLDAIKRAKEVFNKKRKWSSLRRKVTTFLFSWEDSAKRYIELYNKCLS